MFGADDAGGAEAVKVGLQPRRRLLREPFLGLESLTEEVVMAPEPSESDRFSPPCGDHHATRHPNCPAQSTGPPLRASRTAAP